MHGTPLTIAAGSLLSNDTDADGDPLSVNIVSVPSNGTLTPNGSGYTYSPNSTFAGTDYFTYQAYDGIHQQQ